MSERIRKLERHEESEHGSSFGEGYYAGPEDRTRQERQDGSMISEDHSATANLPQMPIMKEYAKVGGAMYPELNDTISGLDEESRLAMKHGKKERFPSKY